MSVPIMDTVKLYWEQISKGSKTSTPKELTCVSTDTASGTSGCE
jgi:hypothetical protein